MRTDVTVAGAIDDAVAQFLVEHRTGWLTQVARAVMWAGTTGWVLLLGLAVTGALVVRWRAYRAAVAVTLAAGAAVVGNAVLKTVFERPRPPTGLALVHTGGWSFPSTHATVTAAAATAVLMTWSWRDHRGGRVVAGAVVTAVVVTGACMAYLGAHWASDVVAGWGLGAAIGVLCSRAVRGGWAWVRRAGREAA